MKDAESVKTYVVPEAIIRTRTEQWNRLHLKRQLLVRAIDSLLDAYVDDDSRTWDELCQLAGYKDIVDLQANGFGMSLNEVSKTVTVYRATGSSKGKQLATAWAEQCANQPTLCTAPATRDEYIEIIRAAIEAAVDGQWPPAAETAGRNA